MTMSNSPVIPALFAVLVLAAMPVFAESESDFYEEESAELQEAEGTGEIKEIRASDREVTLHHEPMEEMNWPAMTMDFRLADSELAEGLSQGDEVRFRMQYGDGDYTIIEIETR